MQRRDCGAGMAASDYWAVKDSLSRTRGITRSSSAGSVDEKIVHDTRWTTYGVFAFNAARRKRLCRLPARLPSTMTQDAPSERPTTARYISLFAQDDYRIHRAFTLNLGVRYDLQLPTPIRSIASSPSCRAGNRRYRPRHRSDCCSRVMRGSAAASSTPTSTTSRRAWESPGIREAMDGCPCAPRRGSSTAASPATSGTRPPTISPSPCVSRFRL